MPLIEIPKHITKMHIGHGGFGFQFDTVKKGLNGIVVSLEFPQADAHCEKASAKLGSSIAASCDSSSAGRYCRRPIWVFPSWQ